MKILVVCQFYYPENFVITNICEKLASFGHDVTVLTGKPNYGYGYILPKYKNIKHEERNGVHIERVHLFPRKKSKLSIINNYLSFYFSSRKWVRRTKEKFDVVYSFSLSPVTILSAGNLYKKKHNVRHVVHCVDLWPESVVSTKAVRKKSLMYHVLFHWSKRLYNDADEILIGSPSFTEYFKNILKINNKKLTYVPQCSLLTKCELEPINYDNNFFNILYCGNLGYVQNVHLIIEAMKLVKNNIKFYVIGMGPLSNKFIKEIKENNLENKIIYLGPMGSKEASRYFVNIDAFYLSLASSEFVGKTIPNKIMTSLAFAKPIIGVIKGDGEDVLKNANGSLICNENGENIAQNLDKLSLLNAKVLKEMGNNNLTYYKNNFDENVISKQVENSLLNK